jgi:hypothetical protein
MDCYVIKLLVNISISCQKQYWSGVGRDEYCSCSATACVEFGKQSSVIKGFLLFKTLPGSVAWHAKQESRSSGSSLTGQSHFVTIL